MKNRYTSKSDSASLASWNIPHGQRDLDHCQHGNVLTQIWALPSSTGKLHLRITFRRLVERGTEVKHWESFYPGDLESLSAGSNWARLWLHKQMGSLKPLLAKDRSGQGILERLGFGVNQKLRGSWKSHEAKESLAEYGSGEVVSRVWANSGKEEPFYYKVSFKRGVKTPFGIDFVTSFSPEDLYHVWRCVDKTILFLNWHEKGLRLLSPGEKKASPAGQNRQTSHNNRPKR